MRPAPPVACVLIAALSTVTSLASAGVAPPEEGPTPVSTSGPLETRGDPAWEKPRPVTSPPAEPQAGPLGCVQVNVLRGRNVLGDAANEPSIAVDPTNPDRMVIGWRQFDDVQSNFRQAGYAYSQDGGRSWHSGTLDPGVFRSDPVLGVSAQGRFFYSSLRVEFGSYWCDLFISDNGGQTWTGPTYAYGGDKQWITVDRTLGMGRGNIYEAWSTAAGCCDPNTFSRSVDGGNSFALPNTIPFTPIWGTMDVARDGTLYVAGISGGQSRFVVAKSSSIQNPLFSPFFEAVYTVNMGGRMRVGSGTASPNPEGLLGQAWIAVDRSNSPRSGWLYLLCSVDPPGDDPLDVMFARSIDGGTTWSNPLRINNDAPGAWQWFGTMSVAPNGRIDVVWNDTRRSTTPNVSELFYTQSKDGGTTWLPNLRVSPAWDSFVGFPNQNKIGDYYHMVSDDVGADLAWAATFNGEQDVWYQRIGDRDCNGNGLGDFTEIARGLSTDTNHNGIPDDCEGPDWSDAAPVTARSQLLQNSPNPFRGETTSIGFDLLATGGEARLRIFDVAGRAVRTLAGPSRAGRNTLVWDGRDAHGRRAAAGVYLYRLEAPGFSGTRRMVLTR